MNERGCYCHSLSVERRRGEGIPEGYCGLCERCGKPGHTRHFPGPVPYTGAWCDRCYRIVAWTWRFRTPFGWVQIGIAALLIYQAFQIWGS